MSSPDLCNRPTPAFVMPRPRRKTQQCQHCKKSFTSSSLTTHLNQFLQKPPLPEDGIHDVDEIRRSQSKMKYVFPLFKLPAEIRLNIYHHMLVKDYISPTVDFHTQAKHHKHALANLTSIESSSAKKTPHKTQFVYPVQSLGKRSKRPESRLSARYALRILRTCRQVYAEALPIFYRDNHFLFPGHDFRALIQFLIGSGRERSLLLRRVSFATRPIIDEQLRPAAFVPGPVVLDSKVNLPVASMDITAVIKLRSGTAGRNPWNDDRLRRLMIRSLWEYTRPKAVLLEHGRSFGEGDGWPQKERLKIREDEWSVGRIVKDGKDGWPEAPGWVHSSNQHRSLD